MGRAPCCDKANVKRGPWSPEEDTTLKNYLHKHGTGGNWISLPQRAGLKRCGKSCRLRWLNYLRPDIKHGAFTEEEDNTIISLYSKMGSRWSVIAANLPGRTDNDVKNHWNTKLKKKLFGGGSNNINKFNPSNVTRINNNVSNVTSNNNITVNSIFQAPTSSSTPTPSPSLSPSYVENHHNFSHDHQNHQHHDQFYFPIPSFSNLLGQCTNSNIPMSLAPNFSNLANLDHPYVHDPVPSPTMDRFPIHQAQLMSQSSCTLSTIGNVCPREEVSSFSESSTGVYGSSLDDDRFLTELGFGLVQEVLMTPTCNYGDQDDIKPQGLGQGVANY